MKIYTREELYQELQHYDIYDFKGNLTGYGKKRFIEVDDLVKLNKDKGTSAVLKWLLEEVRKSPPILKSSKEVKNE